MSFKRSLGVLLRRVRGRRWLSAALLVAVATVAVTSYALLEDGGGSEASSAPGVAEREQPASSEDRGDRSDSADEPARKRARPRRERRERRAGATGDGEKRTASKEPARKKRRRSTTGTLRDSDELEEPVKRARGKEESDLERYARELRSGSGSGSPSR